MPDNIPITISPSYETASVNEIQEIEAIHRRFRSKWNLKSWHALQSDVSNPYVFQEHMDMLQNPNESLWDEKILAVWNVGGANLSIERKEYAAQVLSLILKNPPKVKRERIPGRLKRALFRSIKIMASVGTIAGAIGAFALVVMSLDDRTPLLDSLSLLTFALIGGSMAGCIFGGSIGFLGSALVLPFSIAMDNSRSGSVRMMAAMALGRLRMPNSVGALASGAVDRDAYVREAAIQALPGVLPTLTPEHYGQLEAETVPNLCRLLECLSGEYYPAVEEEALEQGILESLEKVGDGRAIPIVQSLAERETRPRIQETARRILPILLERQKQETEPRTLLRGAERPSALPEQLLRAATTKVSEPPEVLLRPTQENT